ncbi:AT-rich interactive domain-containing protein 1-like [Triticum dicoccoides]|uniref:AT-rich interactive domain-containing protein 1-like n=1 Tax=Triticum dicoccoides TaxID=85692 RepID=UPI00188E9B2F|nr:AT-rich interactive domain-containing protein 1-like [Triticum dicoccoides]
MATPPSPPPPPPATNSSAPPFKTNTPSPNPHGAPAARAPSSPAAATPPPPMSSGPSHLVLCVRDVIGKLRARGHLSGLEIPDDELTEAGAPALFETVLAAFLAEGRVSAGLPLLPKPLVLGKGGLVDMLPLYLAVRSRGGFAAVTSWAAIAEAVGLEPAADAPIKLVYAKHLWLLEQSIGKPERQDEVAGSSSNAAHRSNAKKDKFLSSHKDHASAGSAHLKRKREVPLQMLNWVRLVAKNPGEHGAGQNHGSQLSSTLMFRRLMFENIDCSKLPYSTTSPQSGLTNEEQPQYDGWDDRLCAGGHSDRILHARTRLSGLADVPDWTGKPSLPYDEPHVLRFLGEPLLPAPSNESLDADAIGKGRPDNCNCQIPGSVACVRFHVTEKRIKLKRELGSAFYAMGFDRIGEDAALTWRRDEEKKFNAVIQNNLPSSKYRFMEEVFAAMGSKGRKDIVSYYHNVFHVRRRAYQNRLTPNDVDSDDDSLEPGFLHLRQGGAQGNSMSASSSGTQRGS